MIFGYKPSIGGQDPYHYGKVDGVDRKYIRVIVGAALPILDRTLGAAVVIGEVYRASGPPSWIALAACGGVWSHVGNTMVQYRMDLKYTHIIVDREEAKQVIYDMRALNWGLSEIPRATYTAPSYASGEIGRSYTGELWRTEGRLVIPEEVKAQLEYEPQMGALAMQCAMCWLKEIPAVYAPLRQPVRKRGQILGVEGLN